MRVDDLRDIQLDRKGGESLQHQLYRVIRHRVINGRFASGLKLPASRVMATELGVSRNTITLALEQLKAEGYIEARQGAGHFVTSVLPEHFGEVLLPDSAPTLAGVSDLMYPPVVEIPESISRPPSYDSFDSRPFVMGLPDLSLFPKAIWQRLINQHCCRDALMIYNSTLGYLPLRLALVSYLRSARGVICDENCIVITQGAQQALSLAAQVLLQPGDRAYVENPGYIGARRALLSCGIELKGVDVDEQGVLPAKLPKAPEGKLLYLTPTHQYPLGGILSLERRVEVLNWLADKRLWLIEDDYDSEYHFNHKPVAAMQGLGLEQQVIYMGSFSKVMFPGLRLGYLVVPKHLVLPFAQAKQNLGGETSLLEQAAMADFIEQGHFSRHLRRMRINYGDKLKFLLEECKSIPHVKVMAQDAGMHIVLAFTEDCPHSEEEVLSKIYAKGVRANALSDYYLGEPKKYGLSVGFASASLEQIAYGVKVIAGALKRTEN